MNIRSQDWIQYIWGQYELDRVKHIGRVDIVSHYYKWVEVWTENHKLIKVSFDDILVVARTRKSLLDKVRNSDPDQYKNL